MHVVEVRETGGPEVLTYVEHPTPEPEEGQLLVELAAAGVNFIDLYRREGRYPLPPPGVPGEEGSGVVLRVGPGVTDFVPGDRVAWTTVLGSYSDKVIVPVGRAILVPAEIDLITAAAVLVQGMTAHYLVHDSYVVKEGDTVLIHAAAGGVGLLLTQMAKARGAYVIGTTSTVKKELIAQEHGADEIIRYTEVEDFAAEVRRRTGGVGVHAVYDGAGAATFDASLASLRTRGTMVSFGGASGSVPPFDIMRLAWAGSLTLTRPYLEHFRATKEEFHWRANDVFRGVQDGSLRVNIGGTYPLAEAGRAHTDLSARRTTGKLLLLP